MANEKVFEMQSACRFCRIGAGEAQFDYDNVLMESDDYFAVASVGGFIEGWTLLCAKRHVLNLSSDYRTTAFREFADQVAKVVTSCYGRPVIFEHGVNHSGSLTGCGTDHAHMHMVPFAEKFSKLVMGFDVERNWVATPLQGIGGIAGNNEYLMMANSVDELSSSAYVSVVRQPTSQFFRRVLASSMGLAAQSNYKLFPFSGRSKATSSKLSTALLDLHATVA
jgi:diadenosine tetraphosphate (Ap4A) HIT family hydrolase